MKKLPTLLLIIFSFTTFAGAQPQELGPQIPPSVLNPYKGYANITELTYGIGLLETDSPYAKYLAGLTTVNGYQINRFFITGAGIGLMFYNDGFLVPLYLGGRFSYPAINTKISWYVNADAGTLLNFEDFNNGTRLFINPLIGVRYTMKSTIAANFGIGIFTQMGPGVNRDSFLNFKLGVIVLPQR